MAGKFREQKFSSINLSDSFFDSLKHDYPGNNNSSGFIEWFNKKSKNNDTALVFEDQNGIGAFICTKEEYNEEIKLENNLTLPARDRFKISTIKIDNRFQGQRIGEGAIGLTLWKWQNSGINEIYVTVFEKHKSLISLLEKYGFQKVGNNLNKENVYFRSRHNIDYSDPYKCFPFINPSFDRAGFIIIEDYFHDNMFPYSELKNTIQESIGLSVENGMTKIYVGKAIDIPYIIGEPIFIYRKYNGKGQKKFKSCLTSFCVVTDIIRVKENYKVLMDFDTLMQNIKNKSVYNIEELQNQYNNNRYMNIIELLYVGYFGEGNNVNHDWLKKNGYFLENIYPTNCILSKEQFENVLRKAKVNVSNVIID